MEWNQSTYIVMKIFCKNAYQVELAQQLQHQLLHGWQHPCDSLDIIGAFGVARQAVQPTQQLLHV